jgi:hypothetical protein
VSAQFSDPGLGARCAGAYGAVFATGFLAQELARLGRSHIKLVNLADAGAGLAQIPTSWGIEDGIFGRLFGLGEVASENDFNVTLPYSSSGDALQDGSPIFIGAFAAVAAAFPNVTFAQSHCDNDLTQRFFMQITFAAELGNCRCCCQQCESFGALACFNPTFVQPTECTFGCFGCLNCFWQEELLTSTVPGIVSAGAAHGNTRIFLSQCSNHQLMRTDLMYTAQGSVNQGEQSVAFLSFLHELLDIPEPTCGDGQCHATETCISCPADCGCPRSLARFRGQRFRVSTTSFCPQGAFAGVEERGPTRVRLPGYTCRGGGIQGPR